MGYWKYFSRETVLEDITSGDLESALDELLDAMVKAKAVTAASRKKIRVQLHEKIEQGATGAIGHGVAVPHIKDPSVKSTVAAFGRAPQGVDFRAGDGKPVRLVFFVVGPDDAPKEHLEFLRWIAGLARDPDFPRFALQCKGRQELFDLLKEMSSV